MSLLDDASAISREDHGPVIGPAWWNPAVTAVSIGGLAVSGVLLLDKSTTDLPEPRLTAIVIFAICSVPFAITMVQLSRLRKKIGRAGIFHLHDPFPLGFSGSALYQRPLRDGAAIRQIEARLQCVETLKGTVRRWRWGKSQSIVTAIAFDEPATSAVTTKREEMSVQLTFRIPEAGPATLDEDYVTIQWFLRLRLEMDGCPNTRSSFEVNVIPVVVKR